MLAAMVRFENGDVGPAHFEAKLKEWFEELRSDRRLRAMGVDLASVSTGIDGLDLRFELNLGAKGKAVLALAQFALLEARQMRSDRQVEIVLEDVTPAAPEPEEAPAGERRKD